MLSIVNALFLKIIVMDKKIIIPIVPTAKNKNKIWPDIPIIGR
jgi:hypothetical protein